MIRIDSKWLSQQFSLFDESAVAEAGGVTCYRLKMPLFPEGRAFSWAELRLAAEFESYAPAQVYLSQDAVLRVPHVESSGRLCMRGDPGASSGLSPTERIAHVLQAFEEDFLFPWIRGTLDSDFLKEPLNYWSIRIGREQTRPELHWDLWTLCEPPEVGRLKFGTVLKSRQVIIDCVKNEPRASRVISALGEDRSSLPQCLIAELSLQTPLVPTNWPLSCKDIQKLLEVHLYPSECTRFFQGRLERYPKDMCVVLLRHGAYGFGFIMPWGPRKFRAYPGGRKAMPRRQNPLSIAVHRADPSWTVGRDQLSQVDTRQAARVAVLGAGALGSFLIDQLARSGVGRITIVDPDIMELSNLGRHLLGIDAVSRSKSRQVATAVMGKYPSCEIDPHDGFAQSWLPRSRLHEFDLIIDLTGSHEVRSALDSVVPAGGLHRLIGWLEPFAAVAHSVVLLGNTSWAGNGEDPLAQLEAIEWPPDILEQEPGCSSEFQAYSSVAAGYAVSMIAEDALSIIDGKLKCSRVRSWLRGQSFRGELKEGSCLRSWARDLQQDEAQIVTRRFP